MWKWSRTANPLGAFLLISWAGFSQSERPVASGTKIDWAMLLPAGEGRFQTASYCALCHTLQRIVSERRADEAEWLQTVQTMVYTNNASIQEDDIPIIAKYLARYFGPSTPKLKPPIYINAASKQILLMLGTLSEADVQKILDSRAKQKIRDLGALEAIVGTGKIEKYRPVISFDDGPEESKWK